MVIAVIGGIHGLSIQLNREVFPTAAFNGATVSVAWPGASPQEVEEQIIVRIEEALADLDGVETITSTARRRQWFRQYRGQALGRYSGEFIDSVIKLEVDSVNNLPQSAFRPVVTPWRSSGTKLVGFAVHGVAARRDLQDIARRNPRRSRPTRCLALPSSAIPGRFAAKRSPLRSLKKTCAVMTSRFDEIVTRAVRSSSLNASAGSVRTDLGDVSTSPRASWPTPSADEFENIIIRQTADGGTLRVRDVANVDGRFCRFQSGSSTYNGESDGSWSYVETSPNIDVVEHLRTSP